MKRLFASGVLLGILFFWALTSLIFTSQPSSTTPIQLYSTETLDDLQLMFQQAIYEAKQNVTLIIYSLRDKKVIHALKEAAERGVVVKVICDPHASSGVAKKLGDKVQTTYRKGKGLMHQKILSVDNHKVWIGSANMTEASLKMHGNLVLGIFSADLSQMMEQKALMISEPGKVEAMTAQTFTINGQQLEMRFLPDSQDGIKKIKQLIGAAKKTIRVAMFTWTRYDLADALIAAGKRGVKIEVILDRNSAQGVSAPIALKLHKAGIAVRLNQGQELLHHKMAIIDDRILINGSANWTLAAFSQNDDCFTILSPLSHEQALKLQKVWREIHADSTPYE